MEPIEKSAVPGSESLAQPRNRRSHPRYPVDEDSTLLLVSHGLSLPSHILDLSLEGCRMRTRERHTMLKHARVEVTFRVNGIAFRFMGVIQWTDGRQMVGIRFVNMIARRKELLAEVISEIEAAAAARAAEEAAIDAAECEPQQQSEESTKQALGQQPEKSEQQPQKSQMEAAAQQAATQEDVRNSKSTEPVPTSTADPLAAVLAAAPLKRDRRAQARHVVDTSATILLIKIGSKLSGRILDLSLGGCRIRSDERFPVGIYTRVETEFRLEGLPFRLGGVVQAIHDRYTVGIRFLDVSHRKREQVEQLIEEIAAQGSEE